MDFSNRLASAASVPAFSTSLAKELREKLCGAFRGTMEPAWTGGAVKRT